MQVLFEIMVQIKQKRGIGVESPSPRSFSGGVFKDVFIHRYSTLLFIHKYICGSKQKFIHKYSTLLGASSATSGSFSGGWMACICSVFLTSFHIFEMTHVSFLQDLEFDKLQAKQILFSKTEQMT